MFYSKGNNNGRGFYTQSWGLALFHVVDRNIKEKKVCSKKVNWYCLNFFFQFSKLHRFSIMLNLLLDDDKIGTNTKLMKKTLHSIMLEPWTHKKKVVKHFCKSIVYPFLSGGFERYVLLHLWLTIGISLLKRGPPIPHPKPENKNKSFPSPFKQN